MTDRCERARLSPSTRAIGSIQSAILLSAFAILLSLFMAAVIFLNGAAA